MTRVSLKIWVRKNPYSGIFYALWCPRKTWEFVGNKTKGRLRRVLVENGCYKKTKPARFFERRTFLTRSPIRTRTCAYQGCKKWSFPGKFSVICFLLTSVLRFPLFASCRRIINFYLVFLERNIFQGIVQSFVKYMSKLENFPILKIFSRREIQLRNGVYSISVTGALKSPRIWFFWNYFTSKTFICLILAIIE